MRRGRLRGAGAAVLLAGAALTGAAAPAGGAPLVPVPVVSCRVQFGAPGTPPAWSPSRLPVALPAATVRRLSFYSDGFVVALAPRGWRCQGLEAADGGQSLSVFPARQTNPLSGQHLPSTAAGVTVLLDYTGHGPGAQLVCGLFPGTKAASLAASTGGCPPVPSGEQVQHPTPDVATFVDPPGVHGSGNPSGGVNTATGVVVFPQLTPEPGSVNVAKTTCTLPAGTSALCQAIVGDFVARELPSQPAG